MKIDSPQKRKIVSCALIITALCLLTVNIYIYIIYFTCVFFLALNLYAKKKIAWNADHLFTTIGRNFDYLIIGNMIYIDDVVDCKNSVLEFRAPRRSLLSSYELLKRLFSLLREGGSAVIVADERDISSCQISVLDVPYLHECQLQRLSIKNRLLRMYLPLVFAPIRTIRFLLGKKKGVCMITSCPMKELVTFCKVRNINLIFLKTKNK